MDGCGRSLKLQIPSETFLVARWPDGLHPGLFEKTDVGVKVEGAELVQLPQGVCWTPPGGKNTPRIKRRFCSTEVIIVSHDFSPG